MTLYPPLTTNNMTVHIALAPSGIHHGNCFLGASYDEAEAKSMHGHHGFVRSFDSVELAVEEYPHFEEMIHCDLPPKSNPNES